MCKNKSINACIKCRDRNCDYLSTLIIQDKSTYYKYRKIFLDECCLDCNKCKYRFPCKNLMSNALKVKV